MNNNLYNEKVDHYFNSKRVEMIAFIPESAERVLEIGCGTGSFGAHLKSLRKVEFIGIEPQLNAAEIARAVIDKVIQLDVDSGLLELEGLLFDCIVFNDVLEHLVDPWDILEKIKILLTPNGVVVASIPNIRYMPVFKEYLLGADWRYQRDGVMDKTHLRFFTKNSIYTFFNSCGFDILKIQGINKIEFPWKYAILNMVTGGRLDDTHYQQFACIARPHGKSANN